jgi:signal transduction histidine kinase
MPFRVTARTILQLGAELISSDAVAFYELIKNAFDAGSKRVTVRVVERLPFDKLAALRGEIQAAEELPPRTKAAQEAVHSVCNRITSLANRTAPDIDEYLACVAAAKSLASLRDLVDDAGSIEFSDSGEGMSLSDLEDVYLTIGTSSRLKTRVSRAALPTNSRPVLGEKGIGRLSAMRLGMRLQVKTTKEDESNWHLLDVNWREFAGDLDALVESVDVHPVEGPLKEDDAEQGTRIIITALNDGWSAEKLAQIAAAELSKLMDPFSNRTQFPIAVYYNKTRLKIPAFDCLLFEHAHATVTASLSLEANSKPVVRGQVNYLLERKQKTFVIESANLKSLANVESLDVLRTLGPFTMEAYWYNRRILEEITGIGDREHVRELIRAWSGGLMLFRDGFRVHPYGGPNDDWLDLDRGALAAPGYKVNRAQLIGKVDITQADNPRLIDQTNREGLRDNKETAALRTILLHILVGQLRRFLDDVDKTNRKPVTFTELEGRVEAEEQTLNKTIQKLREIAVEFEDIDIEPIEEALRQSIKQIERTMADAKQLADQYDQDRSQVIHLAGLGMMVEHIAHELLRTTEHTLRTLSDTLAGNVSGDVKAHLANVESQLISLRKRLSLLDPHTTSGRQVKEPVALVATIKDILRGHAGQFERHGIEAAVTSVPPKSDVTVKMVRGMFIQVIENLISNSVYWLKQKLDMEPEFTPTITVTVRTSDKEVLFTDNGPGIDPADREDIFRPFFTRKPPGQGKGLGLYISRQLAEYHGATLVLDPAKDRRTGQYHTFILDLSKAKK